MPEWAALLRGTIVSGSCAGLGSSAALALAARLEGKAALRPVNASSHWRSGPDAASCEALDVEHTLVGFTTNFVASLFWAVFFAGWQARRNSATATAVLRDALVMSAVAAAVDYGATPKRFTPGWELALSKKGMAIGYGGLALGFWIGTLMTRRDGEPRRPG